MEYAVATNQIVTAKANLGATKLLIYGAGGHAKVAAATARRIGQFEICAFIDDVNPKRRGEDFCGALVFGTDALTELRSRYSPMALVAIGDCAARVGVATHLLSDGFNLATLIDPSAIIASDVILGDGTLVVAGAIINPATCVGSNAIINTASSIDHDCAIGDGVHIGPGTRLGGEVVVGNQTWIGIGATVKDRVNIGSNCVIGAGSLVLTDIPDNVIAYGAPARPIRSA